MVPASQEPISDSARSAYLRGVVDDALGLFPEQSEALARDRAEVCATLPALNRLAACEPLPSEPGEGTPYPPVVNQELSELLEAWSQRLRQSGVPLIRRLPWPEGRPVGVLLSHDVDQIHDREVYRVLADVNHLRRMVFGGERGRAVDCLARIARALSRPKDPVADFEHLLGIEAGEGLRSSFMLLVDDFGARRGARYRVNDPALASIVERVRAAGGEVGVHGSYYRPASPEGFAATRAKLMRQFGVEVVGVRNHFLRFERERTWRAQQAAGFRWDSTWSDNARPGPLSGFCLPWHPFDPLTTKRLDLLEVPLTLMDTTLFRHLALGEDAAFAVASQVLEDAARVGGLVVALWHNNFFNEPEFREWELVYRAFLAQVVRVGAWCATGAELTDWWRARAGVRLEEGHLGLSRWSGVLTVEGEIRNLALEVRLPTGETTVQVTCEHTMTRVGETMRLVFPRLRREQRIQLSMGSTREGH